MINQLQEIGFKEFITTPHIYTSVWNNTEEVIKNKFPIINIGNLLSFNAIVGKMAKNSFSGGSP